MVQLSARFRLLAEPTAGNLFRLKADTGQQAVELLKIVELYDQAATISLAARLDMDLGAEMLAKLTLKIV